MNNMTTTLKTLARSAVVAAVALLYLPGLQAAPAAGLTPATGEGGKHERHPHIRAAIHELREAGKEMKEAAHDFGGHREEALKATDGAIEQLKICLESAPKAGAGKAGKAQGAGAGAGLGKVAKTGGEGAGAAKVGAGEGERHPHIHAALRELHEAARELKEAAHDFGGHREDALKATDHAIEQLKKALEFDKK